MNNYRKAIEKNETTDFLLGKGDYYIHNKDYDDHDITATYMDIFNYGKEVGEIKMYEQVSYDLFSILKKNDLNINEYTNLFGFIFFYFKYKFGYKKLKNDWEFSNSLKKLFMDCFCSLKRQYDMSNVIRINTIIKEKYDYTFLDI
ncbi:hypothetical protein [Capnocytophaga sp.]|uniref:hypothetical protein n=1 Tax=Capnocytophaga sp. TaxID=44737 RepID=UPI0026DA9747|nr:hypothetical protein [Capnocytophaga sp.]MDO5105959.1 hypothetical protein [Capnocytophaga sp.]